MLDNTSLLVGSAAALPIRQLQQQQTMKPIQLQTEHQQDRELEEEEELAMNNVANEATDPSVITTVASCVKVILQALGEDTSRDGLLKTPTRVAKAFLSATSGRRTPVDRILQGALFVESGAEKGLAGGSGGMVVVRSIDLYSTCESCLLPFRACCHMAYIPSKHRVVGLSKLPRVAEIYGSRLQTPEKLVKDIAEGLYHGFNPLGVAVVAECWHLNWPDGCGYGNVEPVSWMSRTVSAGEGEFRDRKSHHWTEYLAMLQLGGINLELEISTTSQVVCPMIKATKMSNGLKQHQSSLEVMVPAVRAMLEALGEDPYCEALKQTPLCYSSCLLLSTQGSRSCALEAPNGKLLENGSFHGKEENDGGKLCSVLKLPFSSQCEHHLLPFSGVAHVAYLLEKGSEQGFWDRLKLQKIIKTFSCRLQVQERITKQIGEAIMASGSSRNIKGAMVVLEASHVCMVSRGIKKVGSVTATMATFGSFASDHEARSRFLLMVSRTK